MSLFEPHTDLGAPLAARMRPRTLEEFVGQEHIVGPGKLLRKLIESDDLASLILYGPPGTGKTSLAHVIAEHTRAHFVSLNAVTSGVADMRRVIREAQDQRRFHGRRTILFIDEIHRFNKAQQDLLLPYVEDGTVVLIGATTENPFFEVNSTLVSRSRILRLEPLPPEALARLLERALADGERGLAEFRAEVTPEATAHLIDVANGDARIALNALELAVTTTPADADGVRRVTVEAVADALQRRVVRYDKFGDQHYDAISAFIKSLRGSDPDAAVYWMARMLHAGEDPRYICRRMIVHAAEDVGLADPQALLVATATAHAVEYVGLPEARIPMAQAAIYIACAPKSNAVVRAIDQAAADVEKVPSEPVPMHLRDTAYPGARSLGHGRDYEYPHDHLDAFVAQDYVPDAIRGRIYYRPTEHGDEAEVYRRLRSLWADRKPYGQADGPDQEGDSEP